MQARWLPAQRGIFWLLAGHRLFRRNPAMISALTLAYLMIVQLAVLLLPGAALFVVPVMLPTLVLVVANGARLAEQNGRSGQAKARIPLAALAYGIKGNGRNLLRLGLLHLVGIGVLVGLLALLPVPTRIPEKLDSSTDAIDLILTLTLYFVLSLPLLMASCFAPYLAGWDREPALKALFFSYIGCIRNLRALGYWLAGVMVLGVLLPALCLFLAGLMSASALAVAAFVVRMLMMFLFAPTLAASLYVAYRDIFHPPTHVEA